MFIEVTGKKLMEGIFASHLNNVKVVKNITVCRKITEFEFSVDVYLTLSPKNRLDDNHKIKINKFYLIFYHK